MTPDDVREFIRSHHHAIVATRRRDGGVQMSPVAVVCDEDGTLAISSRETAAKTHNVRRDGRAAVCVFTDRFFGEWVQAEGPAVVESLPEAMDALVRYYRVGFGEHEDWDDYRAAMTRDKRVVLRITIDRVGPNVQG
jgi:PPOX class probable F420-dependent enzyme